METDMVAYYRARAAEYERIYNKPERQIDLHRLHVLVQEGFRGHHVLEVSCGTGYWTESLARVSRSITACDINEEVLAVARNKSWGSACIKFIQADSYTLPDFASRHSAAFSGFWWSHIPKRKLVIFLQGLHARLNHGAKVMFIDNRYVAGSSTPVSRVDEHGDSFQNRRLADGSVHEVLKNFPSESELLQSVAELAATPQVITTDYFWVLTYTIP